MVVIVLSGAIICESELAESDIAILFMDTGGLGTMCGHGTIALARYLWHSYTPIGSSQASGVSSGLAGFLELSINGVI